MRLRNVKNANDILLASRYYVSNPKMNFSKWNKIFNNDNEIHVEIGMGKGDFIIEMAKAFPNVNFIGIEKYESVLVRAVQKLEYEKPLNNLILLNIDAINLADVFDGEISKIYLNFSDPWPKKRHYKRRLTYEGYLKIYDEISKDSTNIELKTDNDSLFINSLISLNNFGYKFEEIYLDLLATDVFNIKTEYEIKFSSIGYKIKKIVASKTNIAPIK